MSLAKIWDKSEIWLRESDHVYIHKKTGKTYKSVTTTLSDYENHFDADAVSLAIVNQLDTVKQERYIGMSQQQILDYWVEINDEANEYGTKVHAIVEKYLLANRWYYPDETTEEGQFEQKVIDGFNCLNIDEGIAMFPERILFAEQYELAGMTDLIVDLENDFFTIWDWKGLPIDTPIFTNNGWKTMGTISISDMVYDMNGKLSKVLHASEVKNKTCYSIKFDNNETIVSDFEHRWLVSFYKNRQFKDVVMTTEELYYYMKDINSDKRLSEKIPKVKIAKPLENEMVNLPIDPYLFGVWLGNEHSADDKITNIHDDIWSEIRRRGHEVGEDVSQSDCGKASSRTIFGLQSKLDELGVLNNKHLPEIFLHGSYGQRLLVLQGFMDSNGYYNKTRKRFVMSTTKEWQSKAFTQLISTLGIKPTVIYYKKKAKGKIVDVIDVLFTTGLKPFLCINQRGIEYNAKDNSSFKNIISVNLVESVPTRCIEVESETKTFLYGDTFSVTHNTNRVFQYHNEFGFQTLKQPFNHLQQCQYSIYSLQLSVYARMYEIETGKKCRDIKIGHWARETSKFSMIPVIYLKNEAQKLIELHYNKVLKNN